MSPSAADKYCWLEVSVYAHAESVAACAQAVVGAAALGFSPSAGCKAYKLLSSQELTQARHTLNEVQQQLQDSSNKAMQSEHQHQAIVMRLTRDLEQEQTARSDRPALTLVVCTCCQVYWQSCQLPEVMLQL